MKNLKITVFLIYTFLLVCVTPSLDANAQQGRAVAAPEISFTNKAFTQVLADAKKGHKKIFVDVFAVWCGPCKALQRTTFKDPKAAAYYNSNFINISIDIEKGEGPALAKKWNVQGLPTLLILDENGKVIADHTGYVDGQGLLAFAREASAQ